MITIVGRAGGTPDTVAGRFCVVVRSLANQPLNNSSVVIDFSELDDARIASDQLNPNYLLSLYYKSVRSFANSEGTVCFTILGASSGASAPSSLAIAHIRADGVLLGSPLVAILDLDGVDGMGANDLSIWFGDFGSGNYRARSDYDGSGSIGANDLSIWIAAYGTGNSSESARELTP